VRFGADQKIQLLKAVPLFEDLSTHDLERIAKLADEVDVPAGKELIKEGERGRQFFVLLSGEAAVTRGGATIATMKDGDFFGEIALVSDRPTTATVTATRESTLLVITDTGFGFKSMMGEFPEVQLKVLQKLVERLGKDD
jgi:CRP-like cAMP-binding protein